MSTHHQFSVLGPLVVQGAHGPVRLGGNRQRILLTLLLLEANRVIGVGRIDRGDLERSAPGDGPQPIADLRIRPSKTSLGRESGGRDRDAPFGLPDPRATGASRPVPLRGSAQQGAGGGAIGVTGARGRAVPAGTPALARPGGVRAGQFAPGDRGPEGERGPAVRDRGPHRARTRAGPTPPGAGRADPARGGEPFSGVPVPAADAGAVPVRTDRGGVVRLPGHAQEAGAGAGARTEREAACDGAADPGPASGGRALTGHRPGAADARTCRRRRGRRTGSPCWSGRSRTCATRACRATRACAPADRCLPPCPDPGRSPPVTAFFPCSRAGPRWSAGPSPIPPKQGMGEGPSDENTAPHRRRAMRDRRAAREEGRDRGRTTWTRGHRRERHGRARRTAQG